MPRILTTSKPPHIMSTTAPTVPKLFQPTVVGKHVLSHRLVLAPLTRFRADDQHVPSVHAATYYAQRATVPGTLLITEGTFPSAAAGGLRFVPGIWSDAQVEAWRRVECSDVSMCGVRGLMGGSCRSRTPCTSEGPVYSASCGPSDVLARISTLRSSR